MENRNIELISLLPYHVRDKFRHYLSYVHDRLIDIALEEGVYNRLEEFRSDVDFLFLLRLLYGYFVVGFQNYDQMLRFFEDKEISGFQIGSDTFIRHQPFSREWQEIANVLGGIVNEAGIEFYVRPTISIDQVLRQLIQTLPGNTSPSEN